MIVMSILLTYDSNDNVDNSDKDDKDDKEDSSLKFEVHECVRGGM